jgi:hypothetical protein
MGEITTLADAAANLGGDMGGFVGAGIVGALVAVVGAFLRSVLAAQKATAEQNDGWKSILEVRDDENERLRADNTRLEAQLRKAQAEVYALRRRLAGRYEP